MFRMTRLASAMAAASLTAIPAYAQTNNELEPVVVTATRTAQTADQTITPVTVITEKDIQKSGANSMFELLQGQPGVTMTSSGGYGKPSSLFLRGANSDHVLVMIDGLKISSATTGGAAWEHIPLDQIERIEIVRGPRSTLYGSQAIGGVIQIFTRKGTEDRQSAAQVSAGSHGLRKLAANTRGKQDDLTYAFSIAHLETDGWDAKNDSSESDADPYENNSISASLGYSIDSTNQLNANWFYAKGKNSYDNAGAYPTNEAINQALGLEWSSAINEQWESVFKLGYSEDLYDDSQWGKTNTRRDIASWLNHFQINSTTLLNFGVDRIDDKVSGATSYTVDSRYENGYFAQIQTEINKNQFIFGGRQIDNEQFGSHFNYDIEWARPISNSLILTAATGKAFAAPTFNDLYYPGGGNSALKPETSRSHELGLRSNSGTFAWSAQIFHTDVDQLISGWPTENVDKARMQGIELETNTSINEWNLSSSVSYIDARARSGSNDGKKLARRPEWTYRIDLDREFGKIDTRISWHGQGHSFDNASNTTRLGGFGVIDARAEYQIDESMDITAGITNLLDRVYETVDGYNSPDRQISIGLNAKF